MVMKPCCIGHYHLGECIGIGSFGEVYRGLDERTGEDVAIKTEPVKARHPQLQYEAKVYKHLNGGEGMPKLRWSGICRNHNILVVDMLGPSLETLFNSCKRRFSLSTVVVIADQMIRRVEYLHSKCYIHRDIKPDNFLIGLGDNSREVNIIDFGLSKKYRDPRTGQHIQYRDGKSLVGTPRYSSINTHRGVDQSRRDDLEAIGYVLVYFLKGELPWQGLRAASKTEKHKAIQEIKENTPTEVLCKDLPKEFVTYLDYCKNLGFQDRPDYAFLCRLFQELFYKMSYNWYFMFDWQRGSKGARESDRAASSDRRGVWQAMLDAEEGPVGALHFAPPDRGQDHTDRHLDDEEDPNGDCRSPMKASAKETFAQITVSNAAVSAA